MDLSCEDETKPILSFDFRITDKYRLVLTSKICLNLSEKMV